MVVVWGTLVGQPTSVKSLISGPELSNLTSYIIEVRSSALCFLKIENYYTTSPTINS